METGEDWEGVGREDWEGVMAGEMAGNPVAVNVDSVRSEALVSSSCWRRYCP